MKSNLFLQKASIFNLMNHLYGKFKNRICFSEIDMDDEIDLDGLFDEQNYESLFEYEEPVHSIERAEEKKEKFLARLTNDVQSWSDKNGLNNDRQFLTNALKQYYLNTNDLECNFLLLDSLEQNYYDDIKSIFLSYAGMDDYYVGFLCKEIACKEVSGINDVSEYFPYQDACGYFEVDYDLIYYTEVIKFGEVVHTDYVATYEVETYFIDKTKSDYQEFRLQLYKQTINKICETYPEYLFSKLSIDEKIHFVDLYKEIESESRRCEE